MMRVAVWTPLPPDPSGIADYNALLLPALALHEGSELTAVIRDDAARPRAYRDYDVIHKEDYRAEDFDLNVYHVGNHQIFHGYQLTPALVAPGVLVLHDPAIADFLELTLRGRSRNIFRTEVAYNLGLKDDDPDVDQAIERWDRTELLLSRRLVESSLTTLVHSRWASETLQRRFGVHEVEVAPFALKLPSVPGHKRPYVTFGVFGNIAIHKRIPTVVRAFAEVRRRGLDAHLIVAGRLDYEPDERLVREIIKENDLDDVALLEVDVDTVRFHQLQRRADVVVGLRHPTAGETSASLLESFALGTSAIVSAVPQNLEFPANFARPVSVEPDSEYDELVAAMWEVGSNPAAARLAGLEARRFVEVHCRLEDVASFYVDVFERSLERAGSTVGVNPPTVPEVIGVNAIGSWAGATGLAEAGRRAALALVDDGVSVALQDVTLWARVDPGRMPEKLAALPRGLPYRVSVSFVNINEFHLVDDQHLRGPMCDYLVAMWYWELPALPVNMIPTIDRVDEIWVASTFVRDVFRRYTDKPVKVMPCVVEPRADESLTRADLGLPEDAFVFLITFDANSTIARKNPYGAIRAFERAFGTGRRDVVLVVKAMHLGEYPTVEHDMRVHVQRLGGILLTKDMSPGEIAALIRNCDVYVSLHRSEGFGLGLAEAMYFGNPVVATANSGNMDFMNATNSCLVSYRSRVIEFNDLVDTPGALVVYEPGNLWVDPDVDDAAHQMKWLFENPSERERLGRRAHADILAGFSVATAGRAMHERLREIVAELEIATAMRPEKEPHLD